MEAPTHSGKFAAYNVDGQPVTVEVPGEVKKVLRVEDVVFVLYDGEPFLKESSDSIGNVIAFDRIGNRLWQIEPYTGHTHTEYADVWLEDGKLMVYATSGYDVEIDPKTGAILAKSFVK